ncbi:Uncharacterised protein [Enterobacter hormaechei]|nr:Uncharacterised protein [Enterobacter hormaechei]
MPAAGFGVTDEALQLQIGFLCYALVLHPNIQAKRARCLTCLPPFNDADQKAERLHNTPHSAGCAFVLMDIERILHHAALDALRPAFVPAVNGKSPRQIRQKADRTRCRVPQVAQRHLQIGNAAAGLRQSALKRRRTRRKQAIHPCPRWLRSIPYRMPPASYPAPHPPAGRPAPHAGRPQHAARHRLRCDGYHGPAASD